MIKKRENWGYSVRVSNLLGSSVKSEDLSRKRKGKREYLNDSLTRDFMKRLDGYFDLKVEVPRIKVGKRQTIEALINEETLLFAKFLRNEKMTWNPRIAC